MAIEDIKGHLLGGSKFNIKPMALVLMKNFNSISQNVMSGVTNLSSISTTPEVWEIDSSEDTNKVL
ncbi:hypothetical protein KAR91_10075 [Candidatus Pacearchaeota archaeon]|nr:hypothetical protein [Candidatus Pacearchaeota archaeon]